MTFDIIYYIDIVGFTDLTVSFLIFLILKILKAAFLIAELPDELTWKHYTFLSA